MSTHIYTQRAPKKQVVRQMTTKNKNQPRILIVDDNEDVVESVRLTLEKWCSIVDVHTDSMQTVAQFKAGVYDLVILDYMMPKMNGFELYKIIKAIDADVKICIMTACEIMASDISRREFEQLNPPLSDEFILRKPFDGKMLFSKLWQMLDGNKTATVDSGRKENLQKQLIP